MVPLLNTTLSSIADTHNRPSRPINVNKVVVKKYEKSARVSKKKILQGQASLVYCGFSHYFICFSYIEHLFFIQALDQTNMSMLFRGLRPGIVNANRAVGLSKFTCSKNPSLLLRFNSSDSKSTKTNLAKINEIVNETHTDRELVSGAPAELAYTDNRVVHIYKQAKSATQSSERNSKFWKLEWDIIPKGNRWENDLIGYQGTSDYMHCTDLKFDTKEAAIRFAESQGWDYEVSKPHKRKFEVKQYAFNFIHSKKPLKIIRCK